MTDETFPELQTDLGTQMESFDCKVGGNNVTAETHYDKNIFKRKASEGDEGSKYP